MVHQHPTATNANSSIRTDLPVIYQDYRMISHLSVSD